MAHQIIVHLHNEADPIICEVEKIPPATDNYILVSNPRKRDGKPLSTLAAGVTSVIYPWTRIAFIELTDVEDSRHTTDPLMSFFREDGGRRRS